MRDIYLKFGWFLQIIKNDLSSNGRRKNLNLRKISAWITREDF